MMPLGWLRLAAVAAAVAALSASLWGAYRHGHETGAARVQARWDADRIRLGDEALRAEQAARQRERELVEAKQRSEEIHAENRKRAARDAAAARAELDRLRDALARRDAPAGGAPEDPAAIAGSDGAPERRLLGACAGALVGMAGDADRLSAQLSGLQAYVREVCTAPPAPGD